MEQENNSCSVVTVILHGSWDVSCFTNTVSPFVVDFCFKCLGLATYYLDLFAYCVIVHLFPPLYSVQILFCVCPLFRFEFSVVLGPQRLCRLLGMGSPGWPPQLSHRF